ncbi:hypothetical protein CEP52_007797 [Fusarium oligoseptatum]|uniref:Major facilitator superfamily (MFS) profile domain-containing protein n=1 Tax=Fusarium oligoseptatum TaxID=2604345 RepID=A0A428TL20_9HYPO|nr:hypothetical protein CEP52_007797 [Fusarium oligoseptatum]
MSSTPIPGTVQLVDIQGVVHAKHGEGHKDIVLIPQPSDHPDDPLSWTPKRKLFNIFWAMTWLTRASLSPTSVPVTACYISFWDGERSSLKNVALTYGRRITLVASILLTTFVTLWSAYVESRAELFLNRIILGIVSSPMETLIEVIIGDVFFIHERGLYMGIYSWNLWCSAFLCPVASGFVAEAHGWRWIQYILSIIGGVLTVLTFLFFEETMFSRPETVPVEALEISTKGDDASGLMEAAPQQASEKADSKDGEQRPASISAGRQVDYPTEPKTFVQKLALWGFESPRPATKRAILLPFQLLRYPTIVFSGFLVGGILSWYNVVGGSLALILGNEPYNLGTNTIGLFYLAAVVGVSIGCVLCSTTSDRMAVWFARRNGGIMEPEQRLWLCLVCIVAHPAGCLLYGIGAAYHLHWVGIAFGLGLISVTLPIGSALAFNYILDSYKEVAGEGLVTSILIRNLMGFAFSYSVVPMIENLGLKNAFILIAVLGLVLWCMCLVMILIGKSVRQGSAESYWRLVDKLGATAH